MSYLQSKSAACFATNLAARLKIRNPNIAQKLENYAKLINEFHANTTYLPVPKPTREVAHVLRLYLRLIPSR